MKTKLFLDTLLLFFWKHKKFGKILLIFGVSTHISNIWKINLIFNIFVFFQQILEVLNSNFSELVLLMHIYWDKISKVNKMSIVLTIFGTKKSNLKKSLAGGTGNWLVWTHFWIPYDIWVLKMGVCTQEATLNVFQALRT